MTDHIRWGILGAAGFARKTMAPALNEARRSRLVALATRDPSRAAPFAAIAPGLRVHDSYDALLADGMRSNKYKQTNHYTKTTDIISEAIRHKQQRSDVAQ